MIPGSLWRTGRGIVVEILAAQIVNGTGVIAYRALGSTRVHIKTTASTYLWVRSAE